MSGAFGRRTIVRAAAGGALLAAPWVRPAGAQERTITFAAFSGIFEENYRPAVVEPFMRANPGIRVQYFPMTNSAQMLGTLRAQRQAPQLDVVLMDVSVAKAATDEGLYDPVDASRVPAIRDLFPEAIKPGVAGPAVTFDSLALLYSPERVRPAPTSWRVLWDRRHEGRIAMAAAPDIVGLAITLIANRMAGGDWRQSVERGIASIAEMAPLVQSWDPRPDAFTFIINGQSDLGVGWNARAQLYSDQAPGRHAAVQPEEGSVFQINTLNLVRGSRQSEAALAFMNYALGREAQKTFAERMFYAPTNRTAEVSAAALARTAATPERMARMLDVDWIEVARIRDSVTEQWRRRVVRAR